MKHKDYLAKRLQDPEFREYYEEYKREDQIARLIIECRKEAGLTQKELAEKSGISQGRISKIENGVTKNIELNTIERIVNSLGKKLEYSVSDGRTHQPESTMAHAI